MTMDRTEIRLACLKLALSPDLNQTLATAKAYEDYVMPADASVERLPKRPPLSLAKKEANPFGDS